MWERYVREHQDIKYIRVVQSDALGTCYHLGPREKGQFAIKYVMYIFIDHMMGRHEIHTRKIH